MAHLSFIDRWSERAKQQACDIARDAVIAAACERHEPEINIALLADELTRQGACFVTLLKHGQLRGCIGSLEAHRVLGLDIANNAFAAARHDTRFEPVDASELSALTGDISILSPLEVIPVKTEAQLRAMLRPGIDGLVLQSGWHRATFLPSVWEQLPDVDNFIAHLKNKAGMPPDYWSDDMQCSRYTTEKLAFDFGSAR